MKTSLLLAALMIAMTALGGESIPNGGFENWYSKTYEYPEFYPYNSNADRFYEKTATSNVFKTQDAQNGTYAVRLLSNQASESSDFGYFLNANAEGDPSTWRGGIPINEKPTGIHGYFKYNVATGDSGLVIVKFTKNGSDVGTYFFSLTGVHTTYTEFNFSFSPALTVTPDSMILGFASSMALHEISLPGSELFVDNISLNGVTSQPAKLNGNFETWSSNNILMPQYWISDSNNPEACTRTSDAAVGNFAVELHTYKGEKNGVAQARAGQVSNGNWNDKKSKWEGGIPYDNTKNTLTFKYKYHPVQATDSAEIWLMFKKGGMTAWTNTVFLTASDTYKPMTITLFQNGQSMSADSVIINIQSNRWSDTLTSHLGSVLKIDDLLFKIGDSGEQPTIKPAFVPNGAFELWNSKTYDSPQFYPYNSNTNNLYDSNASVSVFKTTDKQNGLYAARLLTNQSNQKNNFGFFINGEPKGDDPNTWTGGIPISEKPSGLKGYYKYNVASGDTALIIAAFSKNGVNVGTYFLPLYGIHNTYTQFNLTFNPALTVTPDSMILGFASSWAMSQIGIPGSELFIDNVSLTGVTAQPAKLNGDFETWNSTTLETPQSWNSFNDDINACKKTTDAVDGNFALELRTYQNNNEGKPQARPAEIATGYFDDNRDTWSGGSPFTNSVDTLAFFYKYAPALPSDSAQVNLQFRKNNESYYGQNIYLTASATYKYVEMPFKIYHVYSNPDSVVISIQSSLWSDSLITHVGSVLKIDGMYFKSKDYTTSINIAKKEKEAGIYPNPTSGVFKITSIDKTISGIDVYNTSGQKVLSLGKDRIQTDMEIDMTLFARGIYLVRIKEGNKTHVEKLILK